MNEYNAALDQKQGNKERAALGEFWMM